MTPRSFVALFLLLAPTKLLVFAPAEEAIRPHGWIGTTEDWAHGLGIVTERDDLTHLANARAFRRRYRRAIEHASAFREPISLLMIDVDGLNAINDRWGHLFGSAALIHVARILEESKREGDLAARWGGQRVRDPHAWADGAAAGRLAQSVLECTHGRPVRHAGRELPLTISIEIATRLSPWTGDDLFELADRALYDNKRAGRDQAKVAESQDS